MRNPPIFALLPGCSFGPSMAATLRDLCAECYLLHSDRLNLPGDLQPRTIYLATEIYKSTAVSCISDSACKLPREKKGGWGEGEKSNVVQESQLSLKL